YLSAPGAGRDEEFHRAVSELLEEWAHDAVPALPAVRIIAHERSARAHELRDTLARNGIPYVFHAAASADGRSRLQQVGQDPSAPSRQWPGRSPVSSLSRTDSRCASPAAGKAMPAAS